jgi:hypothetical protein
MSSVQSFLVGTLPSITTNTLTNPLERLRIILQTQDADIRYRTGKIVKFGGIRTSISRIIKEEGIQGWFRGNMMSCARLFAGPLISDLSLSLVWSLMPKYDPQTELDPYVATTALTGLIHTPLFVFGMLPFDYLHTRLSADVTEQEFDGIYDCIQKTMNGPDGYSSFFKGFYSSFLSIFPYRIVAVFCYNFLTSLNPFEQNSLTGSIYGDIASQMAVLVGMLASYPFITIKSRLQMEATVPRSSRIYNGEWHCFTTILNEEGVGALFKGAKINVIKGIVGGIMLGSLSFQ